MTTIPENPGWRTQLAVHRAVRRDADRLAAALAEGRETYPAAVSAYWSETAFQLRHHHEFEHTVMWPLMEMRLGVRVESFLARNGREHLGIAAAMRTFATAVASMTTDASSARVALAQMQEAIETHLAHEEADVLPLIPEAFASDDLAFFQEESAWTNPFQAFLPWLLDGAPEVDFAFFAAPLAAPVRAQLESHWMPQRRLTVEALRLETSATSAR